MESNFTDQTSIAVKGEKIYARDFKMFGVGYDVHCGIRDFPRTVDAARIVPANLQEH